MLCKQCKHAPSERYADCGGSTVKLHKACACKCHDVADAGPELLAQLRGWLAVFDRPNLATSALLTTAIKETRAVIAQAEGGQP